MRRLIRAILSRVRLHHPRPENLSASLCEPYRTLSEAELDIGRTLTGYEIWLLTEFGVLTCTPENPITADEFPFSVIDHWELHIPDDTEEDQ